MFYLLECFSCGLPIGQFAMRLELAKLINFSANNAAFVKALEAALDGFGPKKE